LGARLSIAGYASTPSSYILEPIEPDYVRIRYGGDNYNVIYQAMQTTGYMSGDSTTNWNDGQTTWNGAGFIDNKLTMRDNGAAYRRHISPCSVILSANGTANSPYALQIDSNANMSYDSKVSRDIEVSNRSLGAVIDPLTYRPNYVNGVEQVFRTAWNLGLEISALCFFHRWTGTGGTSLLPDITWTGEDWVVVSPTKSQIHGYCGNYFVNGTGQVYFGDPGFYFGLGGPNTVDQNYMRQTVQVGDKIWFPAISRYGTVSGTVESEHTILLDELDSALFNLGHSGTLTNIQWILVRSLIGLVNGAPVPGGIKNPAYRVSLDGKILVSSSYNSFADELPENNWIANETTASTPYPGIPDRLPLMSRTNSDLSFFWSNTGAFDVAGMAGADGHNLPGNIQDDLIDPESRYHGDVGFRGVCAGAPHGCNEQVTGEQALVAIAWGENFYGLAQHIIEGLSGTSATNQIRFYRQSFGPYNSGMRDLKIIGTNQPPLLNQNGGGSTGSELKVLTQQLVLTRHGAPVNGHGYFATDGFRNFFAVADKRGLYAYNPVFGVPNTIPFNGGAQACIQGFYTDAVGRFPIQTQGPEIQNKPYPGLTYPNPNTYRNDFDFIGASPSTVAISPSAPRVLWDGQRFVAVWVEGGYAAFETSPLLCITTFPGSEDAGLQGPELVNPADFNLMRKPAQIAIIESRSTQFGTSVSGFTVWDVACSGKVYAVLWCAGLDKDSSSIYGGQSATVGVTLFQNVGAGATFFDYDPTPYFQSATGQTFAGGEVGGIGDTLLNGAFPTQLAPGDIVVITAGSNVGKYLVVSYPSFGTPNQIDLYPIPPTVTTGVNYTIHHPQGASGAASYVLGVCGTQVGPNRDAFTSPCITWDGKQFVAVWRSKFEGLSSTGTGVPPTGTMPESIQYLMFPEDGPNHAAQIKRISGTATTSSAPSARM
jgi:hypothetical protein